LKQQPHNANAQKNTLLKNAQANAESNFFKRVFFSPTQEKIFPPLLFLIKLFRHRTGFVRNPTDSSSNVNRFEQSVCKLDTTTLRTDRRASANKGLKEMAGEVVNQTVVLLINSSGRLTVSASKPPLL
jgi:hypothetical protein